MYALFRFRTLIWGMYFLFFLSSCQSIWIPHKPEEVVRKPFIHKVTTKGETISMIAEWYTGDFRNWKEISRYNNKGERSVVYIGEKVIIPRNLLVRNEPMDVSAFEYKYERDRNPSSSENQRPGTDVSGRDLDEISDMVDLIDEESGYNSEPQVVRPPAPQKTGNLEIDDKEKKRIQLLQELLKK
jgi:hypothetical protein